MKLAAWLAGAVLILVALGWLVERRALRRAQAENAALQEQVDELIATKNELVTENDRLARLLAVDEKNAAQEPSSEVLRLRGEVGRLRVQERETEQSRQEQMRRAQAKLEDAELKLAHAMKLHTEKLVSSADLSSAKWNVELLKAEAKGDTAEAAQVKLRQAEEELVQATQLRREGLISETEYQQAVTKVDSMKAGK
jgi:hypothetical protein